MFKYLLIVLNLLCIFGINEPKHVLLDMKKLLHELRIQDAIDSNYGNTYKFNDNSPNNAHRYKSSHHEATPNLMNIQTINLFLRKNFEKYLRMESERICRETGRCGCIGGRCANRPDEVVEAVDKIIDQVDQKLADDKTRSRKDDSYEGIETVLRCDGHRCDDYAVRNLIDDVDIIILDTKDLENKDFKDLTRNLNIDINDLTKDNDEDLYKVELSKNVNIEDTNAPSPDDFVNHYEIVKNDVIKHLLNYIQNNTSIPLKHLRAKQKQLLRHLKMKYDIGLVNENDLKSKIVKIVFGKESGSKIYPHYGYNDNIYIPKWHYNSLLQYKKDSLRAQKRVLPLTTQQKERLINKQPVKIIPKMAWRRNMNKNIQQYGIPFNLEVHGLGQINP